MTATVAAIFFVVYAGMILGGLPFLQLDRTGVALLGAIAIVGFGALTPEQAALSIHLPTLLLLFSFMVISAQMRLGGFYAWVTLRIASLPLAPARLLAAVMAAVAARSGGARRRGGAHEQPPPAFEHDAGARRLGAPHPLHRALRREPRVRAHGTQRRCAPAAGGFRIPAARAGPHVRGDVRALEH